MWSKEVEEGGHNFGSIHDIIMPHTYLLIQCFVMVKQRLECLQHLHLRTDPRAGRLPLDHRHTQ